MKQIKFILKYLRSFLPTKLPVGVTAFHKFADDIIDIGGSYADADSMKFAIASQVIHMPAYTDSVPMQKIIRCLRKSAANQVASQIFQDIKAKKEAELKAQQELASKEQAAIESVRV